MSNNQDSKIQLPESWVIAPLTEIASIASGQTPKSIDELSTPDGSIPWFRIADMNSLGNEKRLSTAAVNLSVDAIDKLRLTIRPKGTIVFPKRGGAIATNKKRMLGMAACYDLNTMGLVTEPELNAYLWHWFQTIELGKLSTGTSVPQINNVDIAPLSLPLPPKNEQTRIVTAIESLQQRSARARTLLTEVQPLIERLRQSVLQAAFSGRLTADWRAKNPDVEPADQLLARIRTERRQRWETAELAKYEAKGKKPPKHWQDKYKEPEPVDDSELPELPEGWCWGSTTEISTHIVDCPHSTPKYGDGECFAVDTTCISFKGIDLKKLRRLDSGSFVERNRRLIPKAGDIVFAREGTVGTAVVLPQSPSLCLGQRVMLIRTDEVINSQLICWALMSTVTKAQYAKKISGSTVAHINMKDIINFSVPVIPVDEQGQLLVRLQKALKTIDLLERNLVSSNSNLDQLDQSILSKAFRGELVPQDPNDEPASELLARIRSTREAEAATKKSAKKKTSSKKKAKKKSSHKPKS